MSKKRKLRFYLNLEWMFDRLAHEYSIKKYTAVDHPSRYYTKVFLLKQISPDHNVLDLGCNHGDMSIYLAEKAKLVVGVDNNESAIKIAKEQYQRSNLEFLHTDAYEYLNKTDIKFDVLILSHILEHFENPGDFLRKYTPFFNYVYIELPDFDKTLLNHYRKKEGMSLIYTDIDHISEFDREELAEIIDAANLEIVEAEYKYGIQKVWCQRKS